MIWKRNNSGKIETDEPWTKHSSTFVRKETYQCAVFMWESTPRDEASNWDYRRYYYTSPRYLKWSRQHQMLARMWRNETFSQFWQHICPVVWQQIRIRISTCWINILLIAWNPPLRIFPAGTGTHTYWNQCARATHESCNRNEPKICLSPRINGWINMPWRSNRSECSTGELGKAILPRAK